MNKKVISLILALSFLSQSLYGQNLLISEESSERFIRLSTVVEDNKDALQLSFCEQGDNDVLLCETQTLRLDIVDNLIERELQTIYRIERNRNDLRFLFSYGGRSSIRCITKGLFP